MAVYFASKAYVHSFTQALRAEYLDRGLRVSALCPGPVATGFQSRAGMVAPRLPRLLRRDAADVALLGYRGLMRNRAVVVPGPFFNLVMVAAGGLIFHRAFAPFVRWYHLARRKRKSRQGHVAAKAQPVLKNAEPVGVPASNRKPPL
jgi:short-subunit dehydrogenase